MRSRGTFAVLAALSTLVTLSVAPPASAEGGSSELRCTQKGGFGFGITSDRPVTCVYYRRDGAVEFYTGAFHRVGLDVGPTNALRLAYKVSVPGPITTGALEGQFGGLGVGLTVGSGVGADALVGGARGSAALTPIANVSVTGLNANAGVGVLDLHYAGSERSRY